MASTPINGPFKADAEIVMSPAEEDPMHRLVTEATVNELLGRLAAPES
ncbi:hypothetical protein [Streptomyces humi]